VDPYGFNVGVWDRSARRLAGRWRREGLPPCGASAALAGGESCPLPAAGGPANPTLSWRFDQAALAREQATDGRYGLLTNLDPTQVDAAAVLARYKGQEVVERRYGAFKGPLAAATRRSSRNPHRCKPTP